MTHNQYRLGTTPTPADPKPSDPAIDRSESPRSPLYLRCSGRGLRHGPAMDGAQPRDALPAPCLALRHAEGTASAWKGADQPRWPLDSQAFQADCAGSIPVTRSTAASRETVHRFPATSLTADASPCRLDSHPPRRSRALIRPGAEHSAAVPVRHDYQTSPGRCWQVTVSVRSKATDRSQLKTMSPSCPSRTTPSRVCAYVGPSHRCQPSLS
jgi:hypothetical protein